MIISFHLLWIIKFIPLCSPTQSLLHLPSFSSPLFLPSPLPSSFLLLHFSPLYPPPSHRTFVFPSSMTHLQSPIRIFSLQNEFISARPLAPLPKRTALLTNRLPPPKAPSSSFRPDVYFKQIISVVSRDYSPEIARFLSFLVSLPHQKTKKHFIHFFLSISLL